MYRYNYTQVMKKFILLNASISLIIGLNSIFAQSIQNGDFEQWTTQGPFPTPNSWVGGPSITQSIDAHAGSFAIHLQTGVFVNPMTGDTLIIPGISATGISGQGPGTQPTIGFACTGRPDSLIGYYKYTAANSGDIPTFEVRISKWNTTSNLPDLIGGAFIQGIESSIYTRFSFPISYQASTIPDTAVVTLMSSDPAALLLGSELWVDDVSFVYNSAGIKDETLIASLVIKQQNDQVVLNHCLNKSLKIINMQGQLLYTIAFSNSDEISFSCNNFLAGIYFVIDETAQQSHRFVLVK